MRLRRHGVLVRVDRLGIGEGLRLEIRRAAREGRGGELAGGEGGVDGGHDGEVVLVFVEVHVDGGDGVVERVGQGGVEGAEGEFVDVVGEVEGCE